MNADAATLEEKPSTTTRPALDAYRDWGYLQADLDPLGRLLPMDHPELPAEGDGVEAARRAYRRSLEVDPDQRGAREALAELE